MLSLTTLSSTLLLVGIASSYSTDCRLSDTSYGGVESPLGNQWADLIGVACSAQCYDHASRWSKTAIEHGDAPIKSDEECAFLCDSTPKCDVWTYWPDGIGEIDRGNCNICPERKGGTIDREASYKDEEEGKENNCGDVYDYFLSVPFEETEYSCEDVVNYFRFNRCCIYDREAYDPGSCELFSASPPFQNTVLQFTVGAVTGPVDCETTKWLPFLQPIAPEEEKPYSKWEECSKSWCNSWADDCCASLDWGEPLTCSKGVPVPESGCEYTCCVEDIDAPTPPPTASLPLASDGRLCWVDGHSYGVSEDGACGDADIVKVFADAETLELGISQGWWNDGIGVTLVSLEAGMNFLPINCQSECDSSNLCGGWQYRSGVCVIRSPLQCSPTLASVSSTSTVAGVRGCVDQNSANATENSALDMSSLWSLKDDLTRCTVPHSLGGYAGDTFIPDMRGNSCWYKYFTPDEVYDCTEGRWIILNGGSNVLSFFTQIVNLFASGVLSHKEGPLIGFEETFEYNVIDLVFASEALPIDDKDSNGIIHTNLKRFCEYESSLDCEKGSLDFQGSANWREAQLSALKSIFSEAPYQAGATRVTLVVGQIWQNAEKVLSAIKNDYAWEKSQVIFFGQAMIWYPCNVEKWCDQPILGSSNSEMYDKYQSDLDNLMQVGETTCATNRFDCFFATHGYDSLYPGAMKLIRILEETTDKHKWAHFIELNQFTPSGEVLDGHVTPFVFLTIMQMLWNTVCTSSAPNYGTLDAIEASVSCWSNCEDLGGGDSCSCHGMDYGVDWICQNERLCTFEVHDSSPWEIVKEASPYFQNVDTGVANMTSCFDTDIITSFNNCKYYIAKSSDTCNRVWCGTVGAGWGISASVFVIGLAALLISSHLKKKHLAPDDKLVNSNTDKSNGVNIEVLDPASGEAKKNSSTIPLAKDYLHSIGFARLLASVHIVLGHLYAKRAVANVYFFGWGYTWVPWFFTLSGYVLTHARLNSSDPTKVDSPFGHVAKRLATIFPVYAFSVVFALIIRMVRNVKLPDAMVLVAQSYLLQSWVPLWTEKALQTQCWFLSNMIVYWLGFGWMYKQLKKLSLKWTCACMSLICLLPWIVVLVPTIDSDIASNWYREHQYGSTNTYIDIWTVMLKFHPIFYVHVFVFGMLLAILRGHLKKEASEITNDSTLVKILIYISRFGATLGYLGLILVFTIKDIQPVSYKLSARLSVLLPLQGLILLGLSPLPQFVTTKNKQDPLAVLFALAPEWIGDLSYCQYVLQFPLYNIFPVEKVNDPSFFMFLFGGSVLCVKLLHQPAANAWRDYLKNHKKYGTVTLLILPVSVLALIMGIAKAAYSPNSPETTFYNATTSYTLAPDFVRLGPEVVDLRLNWTASIVSNEPRNFSLINPSILFHKSDTGSIEWIRSVRMHARETHNKDIYHKWSKLTETTEIFRSSILLQSEPFVGDLSAGFDESGKWGLDGTNPLISVDSNLLSHLGMNKTWKNLCEPEPSLDEEQKTLHRTQVDGPEDPKLFELPTKPDATVFNWGLTFSSFPPTEDSSSEECKWSSKAVVQMYLVSKGPALAASSPVTGVKLDCGNDEEWEKNWIAFTHERKVYYIYTIQPHVVVHVRASDGACVQQYESYSPELAALALQVNAIRGSATAVRYSKEEYLALLHTHDACLGYTTLAYTFEADPPFRVLRVSRPLSLQGGSRAFASSLVLQQGKVLVGYGENDAASRMLVMSQDYLESRFDWCN